MAEAICKRCIHHDICDAYTGEETVNFFPYNKDCDYFDDKSDYAVVRHGEWKLDGSCSVCGVQVLSNYVRYCPNCGAEMGGKGDNK